MAVAICVPRAAAQRRFRAQLLPGSRLGGSGYPAFPLHPSASGRAGEGRPGARTPPAGECKLPLSGEGTSGEAGAAC